MRREWVLVVEDGLTTASVVKYYLEWKASKCSWRKMVASVWKRLYGAKTRHAAKTYSCTRLPR